MSELPDVFEMLEPPPGGLAGLRAKLERERTRRARRRQLGAVLGLAAAALIAFALASGDRRGAEGGALASRWIESGDPALVQLGLASAPRDAVRSADEASLGLHRVSAPADDVLYYRAAALTTGSAAASQRRAQRRP